jgi:hypothetical protein
LESISTFPDDRIHGFVYAHLLATTSLASTLKPLGNVWASAQSGSNSCRRSGSS